MSSVVSSDSLAPATQSVVCVVDDDPALRKSLCFLLESVDLPTCGFAASQDFLNHYEQLRIGCLLLDVRMPHMGGLELQEELQRRGSAIPIILITGHGDVPLAVRGMKNGAFDFFEKPINDQLLLDRIHQALKQEQSQREEASKRKEFQARYQGLSRREIQVLDLVVEGLRSPEIAPKLKIALKTVEVHRGNIMRKMKATSLAHLVRMMLLARVDEDTNGTPTENIPAETSEEVSAE